MPGRIAARKLTEGQIQAHRQRLWNYYNWVYDQVRDRSNPRVRRAYDRYVRAIILLEKMIG